MSQVPYYTYRIPINTYWPTRQLHNDSLHNEYTSRLRLTKGPVQKSFTFVRRNLQQFTQNMME